MEKRKKITLKDFARETGVSTSAISRVLNNKETYCSQQKQQEILALAEKWNYKPNIGYRIMTGMATDITAIIFSQKRASYAEHNLRLLVELINKLEERGYATYSTVLTKSQNENYEKLLELEQKGCRSFIFIGQSIGDDRLLHYIMQHSYYYIVLSNSSNSKYAKSIKNDEEDAFFQYLKIFQEKGITNFRLLMPRMYFNRRLKHLLKNFEVEYFEKRLIDIPSSEFSDSDGFDDRYDNAYAAVKNEYRKDPNIQGVICITDYHAVGTAHFFHDAGRKVGEEVLVCGMFNTVVARFSLLPIITSHFDMKETATLALDHLFTMEPVQKIIKPQIVTNRRFK